MMRSLNLYFNALKNSFAARITYRADFFFSSLMIFVSELLIPLITMLVYRAGASFPGWTRDEMLLLQGIFLISRGLSSLLFFGLVWNTLDRVREGTYDILLIKPSSTLFLSIATNFEPDSIGVLSSGILVTAYAMGGLPAPGIGDIAVFLVLMLISLIILFSLALFMAGSAFKWVGNSRIYEIFDSLASFGNYPRSIFSRGLQTVISYIIPITAIGFLPASALLGDKPSGLLPTCLICLVFLSLSAVFWKSMLRQYTSAGG